MRLPQRDLLKTLCFPYRILGTLVKSQVTQDLKICFCSGSPTPTAYMPAITEQGCPCHLNTAEDLAGDLAGLPVRRGRRPTVFSLVMSLSDLVLRASQNELSSIPNSSIFPAFVKD